MHILVYVCYKLYWGAIIFKLNLILNHLRNTMGHDRLSSLSLLSIENEILRSNDFNDVIEQFVRLKVRKKAF